VSNNALLSEGRREQNKREKHSRIVAAARRLFRTQGYAETTTQQIAKAADIASGTLFLYAKSKEDLLILVFKNEMSELIEEVYAEIDSTQALHTQAMCLFQGFIDYHARDVSIARELIRELTFLSNQQRTSDMNEITEAIVAKLASFVEVAITRGEVQVQVEAQLFARCLFSIYYQQLQTWLGGFVSRDIFQQRLEAMLKLLIDQAQTPSK
jgi:AcrR family transcriptional regulator